MKSPTTIDEIEPTTEASVSSDLRSCLILRQLLRNPFRFRMAVHSPIRADQGRTGHQPRQVSTSSHSAVLIASPSGGSLRQRDAAYNMPISCHHVSCLSNTMQENYLRANAIPDMLESEMQGCFHVNLHRICSAWTTRQDLSK
jgi:hypothetical protein